MSDEVVDNLRYPPAQSKAKYNKLGDAGAKGLHFQIDLLTVFMLNALEKPDNWRLSTENTIGSKFDDIIFEFSNRDSRGAILLQAKHKQRNNFKVNDDNIFSVNSKHDDFSLLKYFFSYHEAKKNFNALNCSVKSVIICTNAKIELRGGKLNQMCLNTDDMLYFEDGDEICYTFQDDVIVRLKEGIRLYHDTNLRNKNIPKDIFCEENIKDFLNHLQIIAKYPSGKDLEYIIEDKISQSKFGKCLNPKMASIVIHREMEAWYQKKEGIYIEPVSAKSIFCRIVSDKYCEHLEIYDIFFEHNDVIANNILNKIIHVIPTTEYFLLYIVKVYRALLKEETLFVPADVTDDIRLQIINVFELPQYKYLVIIRREREELNEDIVFSKLQKDLDYDNKKIVLIAQKEDLLAKRFNNAYKNFYSEPNELILFSDLENNTRRRFLTKTITFQDEIMDIEKVLPTTDSRDRVLTSDLLSKLARNETISVGKGIRVLDTANYIKRSFYKNENNTDIHIGEDEIWKENVVLISASPGTGKTTILKKLATILKKENPHLWVFLVELNRYTENLNECYDVIKLLNSQNNTKLQSNIERTLFSLPGRVALLIDGIDEISPKYTDVVLRLLEDCKSRKNKNFAKLFVTTRPHLRVELESKLKVKSWDLDRFSEEDQIRFLKEYWVKNLGIRDPSLECKCEYYTKVLVKRISEFTKDNPKNELTANPLQTRMLAEVFQENKPADKSELGIENWECCKQFIELNNADPQLPQKINFVRLYRLFIEKKQTIFIEEKGNPSRNVYAEEALKKNIKQWYDFHHILALREILDPTYVELFTCSRNDTTMVPQENLLNVGIVEWIDSNLFFVHRTFAEYFVAECIIRELKHGNISEEFNTYLLEIFVGGQFYTVCEFLDDFLIECLGSLPQIPCINNDTWINISKKTSQLGLAIYSLSLRGHAGILQFLCDNLCRGDRNLFNIDEDFLFDHTPLRAAALSGNLEAVQILIERGANINKVDVNRKTPLFAAVEGAHFNIVKYLVAKDADINARDKHGSSPLLEASRMHHIPMVRYLLEKGANPNVVTANSTTILQHLVTSGNLILVKRILEAGVDVNVENQMGETPLHRAIGCRSLRMVKLLVTHGANVNTPCEGNRVSDMALRWPLTFITHVGGFAPLHLAAAYGNLEMAKFLLQNGAIVNVIDLCRCTPLHMAVDLGMARILVKSGAALNEKNSLGQTPLHEAAILPKFSVYDFLVSRGADWLVCDDEGRTPFDEYCGKQLL